MLQCVHHSWQRSPKGPSIKWVRKIFRKTNSSNPLIRIRTCAYQGVRNVSFSENFAYVLNGCPQTPLFYEDPLYFLPPTHFQILSTPPLSCHLQPPPPLLVLWLNGWSHHIWCAILLNDIINLHMSSLGTLVPEGPWYLFYAKRRQVYWGLTHNVVFCWYSNLILRTQTHTYTHKDIQHTQGLVDLHTHINIYLHHLLCAHSSYLYYIGWIIHWHQKITFHESNISFQELFTCKCHISVD